MPGNSQRRGAMRKATTRKGPTVGSGGQRRQGLEGRARRPRRPSATSTPPPRARPARPSGTTPPVPQHARGRPSGRSGAPKRSPQASSEVVAGRNSVVEALRADVPVTTMYVAGRIDSDDRVREALKIATERGDRRSSRRPAASSTGSPTARVHQGLALQVPPYDYAHPNDLIDPEAPGIPLVVALDGITDPRNLGAIVRSVAAFGGHGVVVPERRSAGMTASAWKTSAGAAARIPVALASNLTRALEEFRKAGFFILGLDMDGDVELPDLDAGHASRSSSSSAPRARACRGWSRETCDQIVSIPMSSAVESLNAGIATGVTLYEVARRRAL